MTEAGRGVENEALLVDLVGECCVFFFTVTAKLRKTTLEQGSFLLWAQRQCQEGFACMGLVAAGWVGR